MIYLLVSALTLGVFGFIRRSRSESIRSGLLDVAAAAVCGWIAGLLIGIGARIGMWAIPAFNATGSEFTLAGSLQVVIVFSLYGIGLGIIYELLFRQILRKRGFAYGLLITLVAAYPLASAAFQQLTFEPRVLPAAAFSLLFVGLMFVPFAVALEFLLAKYCSRRSVPNPSAQELRRSTV